MSHDILSSDDNAKGLRMRSYDYDVTCTLGDEVIEGDPEVVIGPLPGDEQAPR